MENMATVMLELQAQAEILMRLDDEVCEIVSVGCRAYFQTEPSLVVGKLRCPERMAVRNEIGIS